MHQAVHHLPLITCNRLVFIGCLGCVKKLCPGSTPATKSAFPSWASFINPCSPHHVTTGTAQHCYEHRQLSLLTKMHVQNANLQPHEWHPHTWQQLASLAPGRTASHFPPIRRGTSGRWKKVFPASQLIFTQSACFNNIMQRCSKTDNF